MPTYDKVSIMDRSGVITYYSSYSSARSSASSGDLIQIWADLTNEQIELLDGVDIWIALGVTIDYLPPSYTTAAPTITDNGVECHCRIYGTGIIKNTFVGTTGNVYECIKTTNANTELEVNCDYIEGVGGLTTTVIIAPSIFIENGKKFHLNCNKVINHKTCGIALGKQPNSVQNTIEDVNIRAQKIEIDLDNVTNSESIAVSILANGFIEIDEIICRHYGHCLLHAKGNITASIRKMSVINNISFAGGIVRIDHGGISGSQMLILYFDEISALQVSTVSSGTAYAIAQGTGILIGRRIYAKDNYAVQMNGNTTPIKGFINCNDIISENSSTFEIGERVSEFIINCNLIEGFVSTEAGLIFSKGTASYLIRNAKLRNNSADTDSRGISLFIFSSEYPKLTLWNAKIVLNSSSNNYIIYANSSPSPDVSVFNYGLFGNKYYDVDNIDLKIGYEGSAGFYLFVENSDLN